MPSSKPRSKFYISIVVSVMEIVGVLVAIVVVYLIINGRRNSDPLNRKCAAEICDLLVKNEKVTPEDIAKIFSNNARYNKQAGHVISMVPSLLIQAGYPKDGAMSIVPLLRSAQILVPT